MTEEEKYKLTLFVLIRSQLKGQISEDVIDATAYRAVKRMPEKINYELAKESYFNGKKKYEEIKQNEKQSGRN